MATGRVIVLNGTSSSGKTTLLKAIQERSASPWLDLGLDRFLTTLPTRYLSTHWPEVFTYRYDATGEIEHIQTAPVGDHLATAMHRAIEAVARGGADVVAEHVLLSSAWAADLVERLTDLPTLYVGVTCPVDVLETRERDRGNRTLGQARAQVGVVHQHLAAVRGGSGYDVEVDTSETSPDAAARVVLERT